MVMLRTVLSVMDILRCVTRRVRCVMARYDASSQTQLDVQAEWPSLQLRGVGFRLAISTSCLVVDDNVDIGPSFRPATMETACVCGCMSITLFAKLGDCS